MQKYPAEFKQYAEILIRTADIEIINSLLQYKITDTKNCILVLKNNCKAEKAKKISQILGKLVSSDKDLIKDVDDSVWGRISLGALGYIGNSNNYSFLTNIIANGKT